jgi:hypothetical protein
MSTNNSTNSFFPLPLSLGGTNANLTPSNGGILYSTATAFGILAATATAGQALLSGASGAPSWSTAAFPLTTTANQLLYSSAANTITGLPTANNGVLFTNGSGVPSIGTAPVVAGGTGATSFIPYSVLCGGTTSAGALQNVSGVGSAGQVLTSNGASALPSWQSLAFSSWIDQTTSVTMGVNSSYISDSSSLITFTLPATAAVGSEFQIAGKGSGGWKIAQAAGQQINFGNVTTTSGTAGYLASTNAFDSITLVCVTANTQFVVIGTVGNITYA